MTVFLGCGGGKEKLSVGSIVITDADIAQREKIEAILHPGGGDPSGALSSLFKGALAVEILRGMGRSVDDSILDDEARRMEQTSTTLETINKIKALFGRDAGRYRNLFVRPAYAERLLSGDVFQNAKELQHERSLASISLLNEAVATPQDFHAIAKRRGAAFARLHISARKGAITAIEGSERLAPGTPEMILRYAYALQPGAVFPAIINWNGTHFVMRYVKRDSKDSIVESAALPRKTYDEWFWERAARIPIKFKDQATADQARTIPWAKNLKW